jgi:hypothetical protein
MSETTRGRVDGPTTCPACGARRGPTAQWCSQCYLRFEAAAAPAAATAIPTQPGRPDGARSASPPVPDTDSDVTGQPVLSRLDEVIAAPKLSPEEAELRAEALVAEFSRARPSGHPFVATLVEFSSHAGGKAVLTAMATVLLFAVGLGLMTLLGLAL